MGDKSPKSKQKDKSQKQGKSDAVNKAKQRNIDGKKTGGTFSGEKEKVANWDNGWPRTTAGA